MVPVHVLFPVAQTLKLPTFFGDHVFKLQAEHLMPGENKDKENMPPLVKEGAMSFCSFCSDSEKLK